VKISKKQLNTLIENYLISEGRRDRDYINNLNISEEDKRIYLNAEASGLKTQDFSWIQKIRDNFDLFHIIQSVLEFKTEAFKQKVRVKSKRLNDPSILSYLNLSSFSSIQELDNFIQGVNVDLSSHDRKTMVSLENGTDLEIVGKFGPWTVILPKTVRGSVSCDFDNPQSTTWCTTKRNGQNLFYSYAGAHGESMMLFYIMDYNRKPDDPQIYQENPCMANNCSRMSLGFVEGQIELHGQDGGISVDASNKGLTQASFSKALGQYYNDIMSAINSTVQKYNGISPAIEILEKSAENLEVLISVIKDYGESEKSDFISSVLDQGNVSPEVLAYLSNDKSESVRQNVALRTDDEVLLNKFSNDPSPVVRLNAVKNIGHRSMPSKSEILERLSNDKDETVRSVVARNLENLQLLEKLSKDTSEHVRRSVVYNELTPFEILKNLTSDRSSGVRQSIAQKDPVDSRLLDILSDDADRSVRSAIAQNESTGPTTLLKMTDDTVEWVRVFIAMNESATPDVIDKLSYDTSKRVRSFVASNPSTRSETLQIMSGDSDKWVRQNVAENQNTNVQTLKELLNDRDEQVRDSARDNLEKRNLSERKKYTLKFLF